MRLDLPLWKCISRTLGRLVSPLVLSNCVVSPRPFLPVE